MIEFHKNSCKLFGDALPAVSDLQTNLRSKLCPFEPRNGPTWHVSEHSSLAFNHRLQIIPKKGLIKKQVLIRLSNIAMSQNPSGTFFRWMIITKLSFLWRLTWGSSPIGSRLRWRWSQLFRRAPRCPVMTPSTIFADNPYPQAGSSLVGWWVWHRCNSYQGPCLKTMNNLAARCS